jgi:hypothetical protein
VKGIGAASNEMVERGRHLLSGIVTSAGSVMSSIYGNGHPRTESTEVELSTFDDTSETPISSGRNKSRKMKAGDKKSKHKDAQSGLETEINSDHSHAARPKPSTRQTPTRAQLSKIRQLQALNAHGRLDFVLQGSFLENQYLSSLGVHMSYWGDTDANSLILRSLYNIKLRSKA